MNLAMFHDWIIWKDDQGYFLDDAFSKFVTAFDQDFDRIIFCGRVRRSEAKRARLYPLNPDKHQVCPFPYYANIYSLYTKGFFILPQVMSILKKNIDQWDLLWLPAPHPIGVMTACLCRRKNKPFFFLVRQNLKEQVRHRCRGANRLVSMLLVHLLERLSQRVSHQAPIFTVGQELLVQYRKQNPFVFPVVISLVSERDLERDLMAAFPQDPRQADSHIKRSDGPVRLLSIGRLDPEKGIIYLIRALDDLLRREKRQVSLTIIGRGKEESFLRQEVGERMLEGAVRFLGYVNHGPELFNHYRNHDLFILPSLTGEGLPQTILEAMASRLPVIATAVEGIPYFIQDRTNGMLIPPADSKALGRAILALADDETVRNRIIDGGLKTVASHTLEREKEKMMTIIRKFLDGGLKTEASHARP
jgi:glycosyltransferase involved in cell wall biosynthesis